METEKLKQQPWWPWKTKLLILQVFWLFSLCLLLYYLGMNFWLDGHTAVYRSSLKFWEYGDRLHDNEEQEVLQIVKYNAGDYDRRIAWCTLLHNKINTENDFLHIMWSDESKFTNCSVMKNNHIRSVENATEYRLSRNQVRFSLKFEKQLKQTN